MAMESLLVLAVMRAAQCPDTKKLNFSGVQPAAAHSLFEASPLPSSQEIPHVYYIDSLNPVVTAQEHWSKDSTVIPQKQTFV